MIPERQKVSEAESYSPPQAARNNAKKVLKWKEEHGSEVKAMTATGWARANQLAKGENLSLETVKRMAAFERHRSNSKIDPKHKAEPWKDNGYVAWLGWGGSAGISWAKSIVSKLDESTRLMKQIGPYLIEADSDVMFMVVTKNATKVEYFNTEKELLRKYPQDGTRRSVGGRYARLHGWLQNRPLLRGVSGPMNGGEKNGKNVVRYEDKGTLNRLSI